MAGKSNIEWTDRSWNPVVGCSVVSPGCTNCYAMRMAARLEKMLPLERRGAAILPNQYSALTKPSNGGPVWTGRVNIAPDHILTAPLRWKKPARIFVNSMSDLFHESVPDAWIDRVFAVMALCPHHTFQGLTKRSKRMRKYMQPARRDAWARCAEDFIGWGRLSCQQFADRSHIGPPGAKVSVFSQWPLPNVWLGVSAEDQPRADERTPDLLATPASVRFVSAEPLLGPIDFKPGLDWIIVGGESGPGARPCWVPNILSIVEQCRTAGVACFVKQLGSKPMLPSRGFGSPPGESVFMSGVINRKGSDMAEWPSDLRVREFPSVESV
jgi:protein gp37